MLARDRARDEPVYALITVYSWAALISVEAGVGAVGSSEALLLDLMLAMALALLVGKLFEELFARLKFPPVIGDLVAGLVLGSALLGVFPLNETVKTIGWFGVMVLLFYAGLETRYRDFMRNLKMYGIITVGEALAAFGIGYTIGIAFGYPPRSAYFIGAVLEATSISVSVRTLIEIGKLGTPEGYTILGVAVLDDLTALITIVVGASFIKTGRFDLPTIASTAATAFLFWIATVLILHRFSNTIVRAAMKMHVDEALSSVLLGVFALAAYLTKYFHLSPLVAAYAVGLAFSDAMGVRRVSEKMRFLSLTFSVIFFMITAAELDIRTSLRPEYLWFYLAMLGGAFLGKTLGGGLTSFIIGYPARAALRTAVGLFPRAEFCVIAAYMGYTFGILGPEVYLAALLIVLVTNLATPPLLKLVFERGPPTTHIEPRWRRIRRKQGRGAE
ncbi:MAG: cation:proton antiporter [Thermoprotei archaeon]|nr:MAG: cation:proton antiporter [Thermoprotei archaeon]